MTRDDPRAPTPTRGSDLEETLAGQFRMFNLAAKPGEPLPLPEPVREYRFHDSRKWRFDFAWVDEWVAVEVDGGGFVSGRHGTGDGMRRDAEKASEAAVLGWRVIRCVGDQVESGECLQWIVRALA